MQKQEEKIVSLKICRKKREEIYNRKIDGRYQCVMYGDRLSGYCEILIFDNIQKNAEWFQLHFSIKGMTGYQHLEQEEVVMWQCQRNNTIPIRYWQALILLGDAVRQNYKYQMDAVWLHHQTSLHIQRIWQKEYYGHNNCSVDWLLDLRDPMQFVAVYLDAIGNKDAVLLYDITANALKQHISREVYAYTWNHVLEELYISGYDIIYIERNPEKQIWDLYITIYGGYNELEMLSVELCLKLILENGSLRIIHEHVLDANHVTGV